MTCPRCNSETRGGRYCPACGHQQKLWMSMTEHDLMKTFGASSIYKADSVQWQCFHNANRELFRLRLEAAITEMRSQYRSRKRTRPPFAWLALLILAVAWTPYLTFRLLDWINQ